MLRICKVIDGIIKWVIIRLYMQTQGFCICLNQIDKMEKLLWNIVFLHSKEKYSSKKYCKNRRAISIE